MNFKVFDDTICELGEGVHWHPERGDLFWVDINRQALYSRNNGQVSVRHFETAVSAIAWIDHDYLLLAGSSGLLKFNIESGVLETVCPIEADNPVTRANDGRADPWGGFWIGTMGRDAEPDAGAIYRYFRGELRNLFAPLTIPNAICFSPDAAFAYFADTMQSRIWRQSLNPANGWPVGEPELFLDFTNSGLKPDGAVCDTQGYLWNAQWGAARVARYHPDGTFDMELALPADNVTCPGFGGAKLDQLFVTTAIAGLNGAQRATQPNAGKTFCLESPCPGQKEHQVIL